MPTTKHSSALAGLTLAVLAFAGCAAVTPHAVERPSAAEIAPTPGFTVTGGCSDLSDVVSPDNALSWERQGTLQDLGAREFARGTVTVDEDGAPVSYAVAPGDVEAVVAERLCAYPNLASMNHRRDIHPGQVLWLTPDPEIPWIPYYNPADAPAGFQQLPYQQAIEAAGSAVDAGDVGAVRTIWNDTLKGMFTDQGTIDAVQEVVDSGDLGALRQVFS